MFYLRKPSHWVTIIIEYIYIYIYIYIQVTHNNSKTHNITCYKLVVHVYMFRPHCSHIQANLYGSSTLNVCTVRGPIVCTNYNVWEIKKHHFVASSWSLSSYHRRCTDKHTSSSRIMLKEASFSFLVVSKWTALRCLFTSALPYKYTD